MVERSGSYKKHKLPARYPREREIMVFSDMSELDHVLELLSDLGNRLSAVPNTITSDEWEKECTTPLAHLVEILRKAYFEYERFWQLDGWMLENDPTLSSDLSDFGDMRWRVKELEDGRLIDKTLDILTASGVVKHTYVARAYDPAQLACAQSLYMALALMQSPGGKDWIDQCIGSLRQELTRYHAAALEMLLVRNAVFTGGRQKGSFSKATMHIFLLAKTNRCLTAKELFKKADSKIIGNMLLDIFSNHVRDARKQFPKKKKRTK
jgi:hypothetical protein